MVLGHPSRSALSTTQITSNRISCENDVSLLVQEDLIALGSKLNQFHSRILRTWVQGLAAEDQHRKRDKKRAVGDVNDAPAPKKRSNSPLSTEPQEQEGTKNIAKEDEYKDEEEENEEEEEEENGDEDEDADEDEDSDDEDEENRCGASGDQVGAGDGKSDADGLIVCEERTQHHKEDGKRALEGVNDAPAAKEAKTSTLSTSEVVCLYVKNSVPQWGAESSLAGQWLPTAGGDGAWAARTGSGPMRMCGDIFTAERLWRGPLLTTGHLSSRHPVVVGAGCVARGFRRRGGRRHGRAPGAALPSACGVSAV
jgi:hypothetical protein